MRTRLAALTAAGAVAVAAMTLPGMSTASTVADMQDVLKAAQIDPQRPGEKPTPGAEDDVRLVEQALRDEGLLEKKWVDGSFGTKTVDAYRAFQESLGYTGLAANGLPGAGSLRKLADGRFTVENAITPGDRVTRDGKTVNTRTNEMLSAAEKALGQDLPLEQGSYNPGGDPTSKGTHDGGGVVDIAVDYLTEETRVQAVRELRTVGFAAWLRTPDQGNWPYHIHAVAINDSDLSEQAQEQIGDYYLGKDGLKNDGPDDGPKVTPIRTWEEHEEQS